MILPIFHGLTGEAMAKGKPVNELDFTFSLARLKIRRKRQ